MTTLAEVLEAARRLPIPEQRELILELREALVRRKSPLEQDDDDWLPANFSEELTEAFFESKCRALSRETP